jgi:hypothetical protein
MRWVCLRGPGTGRCRFADWCRRWESSLGFGGACETAAEHTQRPPVDHVCPLFVDRDIGRLLGIVAGRARDAELAPYTHQGIANARPIAPLPELITDPDRLANLTIHRRDRLGGVLGEYEHAA